MKQLKIDCTLQRGDEGQEVRELFVFLQELGYLPGEPMGSLYRGFHRIPTLPPRGPLSFSGELEKALAEFQKFHTLNVTGSLNEETLHHMKKPRCGFPDIIRPEYVIIEAWDRRDITYHFNASIGELQDSQGNLLPINDIQNAVRRAFATWQQGALNRIRITEAADSGDIEIYGHNFGGTQFGGTYPPQNGDMYLDRDIGWSVGTPASALDLESGALHELGHALGLDHSFDGTAMDPELDGTEIKRALHQDDIDGIRALYP